MLVTVLLVACPGPKRSEPERDQGPPNACTKAYEKCELSTGVLGICDVVDCPPGSAEPCLQCRSQH